VKKLSKEIKKLAATSLGLNPNKVYHKSVKFKVQLIAYVLTILVIMIAVIITLIINQDVLAKSDVTPDVVEVSDPQVIDYDTLPGTDDEKQPPYETVPVCAPDSTFKSWMDYRKITSTSSWQWKLQQHATTDESGFRKIDEYFMVAMAKQYGPLGTKYLITLSSGLSIPVIIGDIKGNTTCSHPDTSILEFIIDIDMLLPIIKRSGNVNKVFEGTIIEIRVVEDEGT
jgi:hypothetical protein